MNQIFLKFKQIWEFICRLLKRITGFSTPFFGISWKEDDSSQPVSETSVKTVAKQISQDTAESVSETSVKTVAKRTSQETSEENSIPSEIPVKKSIKVRCAFCSGYARDPYKLQPCRVCKGLGNVILKFINPIRCNYCQGYGNDPYKVAPCRICGGVGLVEGTT